MAMAPATEAPTPAQATLTAVDRCDRCGAQAYVRVVLAGSDLLFCGHHWTRHAEPLLRVAEHVVDETHRLTAVPAVPAVD